MGELSAVVETPEWLKFFDAIERLSTFAELSAEAIHSNKNAIERFQAYQNARNLLEELGNAEKLSPIPTEEELQRKKEKLTKYETFAKEEVDLGYPYLFGLCVIRMWGILNSAIDEIALVALGHRQEHLASRDFEKLKVPYVVLLNNSPRERLEIILQSLKKAIITPDLKGVERLEVLLKQFGLSGGFHPAAAKTILELNEVRDNLVHRDGIADEKLVRICPWLRLSTGQPVRVDGAQFSRMTNACIWYILDLRIRWGLLTETNFNEESARNAQAAILELVEMLTEQKESSES